MDDAEYLVRWQERWHAPTPQDQAEIERLVQSIGGASASKAHTLRERSFELLKRAETLPPGPGRRALYDQYLHHQLAAALLDPDPADAADPAQRKLWHHIQAIDPKSRRTIKR